jgi:hypothetical protein
MSRITATPGRALPALPTPIEPARHLGAVTARYTADSERARHLVAPVVEALVESGLARLVAPTALGGAAAHPGLLVEVVETIAAADASAGERLDEPRTARQVGRSTVAQRFGRRVGRLAEEPGRDALFEQDDDGVALHTGPTPLPKTARSVMSESVPTGDEPSAGRQCGRCRQMFAMDATAHPTALREWWLCRPCYEALLGTSA